MADILDFPENKIYRNVPNEAVQETYQKSLKKDADILCDDIFQTMVAILNQVEVGTTSSDEVDVMLIKSAVTGLVYRKFGIDMDASMPVNVNTLMEILEKEDEYNDID